MSHLGASGTAGHRAGPAWSGRRQGEVPHIIEAVTVAPTTTPRPGGRSGRVAGWLAALVLAVAASPAVAQPRPAREPAVAPPVFPLELRRSIDLGNPPLAHLASDGERVFAPIRPGSIAAVDLTTGTVAWRAELAAAQAPVIAGDSLVVATADTLEALSAASGENRWRIPLPAIPAAPLLVSGENVFLPLVSGELRAVNVRDGTVLWRAELGASAGTLAAGADLLLVALADGRIAALSAHDGARRWEQKVGARATGLAIDGTRLYAGSLDNFFYALDVRNGRIRWRWRTGGDIVGTAVVDDSRVYFASLDNLLRALDRSSGVQQWKRPLTSRPLVGPVLVGGTLLLSGMAQELTGIVAATGEAKGRYHLDEDPGTAPLFVPRGWAAEDVVALVTAEGTLMVLGRRVSPGLAPLSALPGTPVDVSVTPPPE